VLSFDKEETMQGLDLLPLLSFVLITTFSPGPNNVSSASMGVLHGYRKTLRYLAGIAVGFVVIMLLCGWISNALLRVLPAFEVALRVVGACYILWLAYETLRASYNFGNGNQALLGFTKGLLLQVLNPKVIVYGLTLYSSFLASLAERPLGLILSALLLAGVAFCATSTWALFGTAIRAFLHQPKIQRAVNLVLALLLVYTAVELSGLLDLIG
jgi:cysteine/O-acetylserine efflux protein